MFLIIYNFFFINRLVIYFSIRSRIFLCFNFFVIFNWSYNIRMIYDLFIGLLNIESFFNSFDSRLNKSLSNSGRSWNGNGNRSINNLIINLSWNCSLFGIDWSLNFGFCNNGCLYNHLFNHWLRYYLSGNNWLRYNFTFKNRLRNNFLSLTNLRRSVINFFSISSFGLTLSNIRFSRDNSTLNILISKLANMNKITNFLKLSAR